MRQSIPFFPLSPVADRDQYNFLFPNHYAIESLAFVTGLPFPSYADETDNLPNRLSFGLMLSITDADGLRVDYAQVDLSTCQFTLHNFYSNAAGEATLLPIPVSNISASNSGCNYDDFESIRTRLKTLVEEMEQATTYDDLMVAHIRVQTATLAQPYQDCIAELESLFDTRETLELTTPSSTVCPFVPGSPEYETDPCCNVSELQWNQCCVPRPVAVNQTFVASSSADAINSVLNDRCDVSECAMYVFLLFQFFPHVQDGLSARTQIL